MGSSLAAALASARQRSLAHALRDLAELAAVHADFF